MKLQKDYFLLQLLTLKPTEEYLRSLAIYTKTFSEDFEAILEGLEYTHSISSIHHRLILYYLINEILVSEKDTHNPLVVLMKSFVKRNFQNDVLVSLDFENIHGKYLELEKFWRSKSLVEFDDVFTLEEVTLGIKQTFKDKKALVEYLEAIVEHYKSVGRTK